MSLGRLKRNTSREGLREAGGQAFGLHERNTKLRTEFYAGLTAFMAAAYLIVVIPKILASGGVDVSSVTTATIVGFALGTLSMAFYTNLPLIVGPGIGGAALVSTTLVVTEGIPWQVGMAIAFWSGVLFLLLTVLGLRQVVADRPCRTSSCTGSRSGRCVMIEKSL